MRYASSMSTFVRENDKEIRRVVFSVCRSLNRFEKWLMDDIVQDVYFRLHHANFLGRYDSSMAKVSTYVFRTIYRVAKHRIWQETNLKKPCFKKGAANDYRTRYVLPPTLGGANMSCLSHSDQMDQIIHSEGLDHDYSHIVHQEPIDGLPFELQSAMDHITNTKANRHHNLNRRKNKEVETDGYCIMDILKLIRDGFSSHEIATIYGVTPMAVCHVKKRLAEILTEYGFSPF